MVNAQAIFAETSADHLQAGKRALEIEARALAEIGGRLDDSFNRAVELLLATAGKVVVCGVGKSGHIGRKIAATLASTGTPAFFVHPGEAGHGDLGVIDSRDTVAAISYSGESEELSRIVPQIRRIGARLLAMTANENSSLAKNADVFLSVAVGQEACPINLAPTASTTATLALGDALAVALMEARGFCPDDFARTHPAGALGRRLLTTVADVMRVGDSIPMVKADSALADAVVEMTEKRMGMTLVAEGDSLIGIFTDGDLRRAFSRDGIDIRATTIAEIMTATPQTISPSALAADAAEIMRERRINQLAAVDEEKIVGALNMHDLLLHKIL